MPKPILYGDPNSAIGRMPPPKTAPTMLSGDSHAMTGGMSGTPPFMAPRPRPQPSFAHPMQNDFSSLDSAMAPSAGAASFNPAGVPPAAPHAPLTENPYGSLQGMPGADTMPGMQTTMSPMGSSMAPSMTGAGGAVPAPQGPQDPVAARMALAQLLSRGRRV
jgi:hypothetical protein